MGNVALREEEVKVCLKFDKCTGGWEESKVLLVEKEKIREIKKPEKKKKMKSEANEEEEKTKWGGGGKEVVKNGKTRR